MITNKDIRVENGFLIINGDKYPLDGQSPETIMQIVEDNSDTTPTENSDAPITSGGTFSAIKDVTDTIGDITQTGITGASVAAQLGDLGDQIGALFNEDVATHTMALNDTYTIPENVFSHKLLLFHINRGGSAAGGFVIRPVFNTGGAVYGGFVYGDLNHYAKLAIQATGVVTLAAFKWDDATNIELKVMGLF